jgi:NAD(P)-dependent dehydrogenase (short-subunit alcohol dehydrogenase family)
MSVAVVTGGSRGIGAATARLFAERGWDVCIGFARDHEAAAAVVAQCEASGVRAVSVQGDLAADPGVDALFAAADALGPLDALVNNAGIVGPPQPVAAMTTERIERMLAVNALGPFLCARAAVRRMHGRGGAIVNVGSAASRIGSPNNYVDYAASKGAIDTMTLGLAKEVAADGIRVNCVRPGVIDTEIHASGGQPDRASEIAPQIPMQRPGEAIEIARAIVWLCSEEASYVTGAILDVSGGR